MIPITRKELYLNKIVGNNDYETPEKPITTEEFFFAEILGEAVQAPEPLTRYQMYLAKIAGREIEIPYPKVRLEYFLAKAAGMDVETPVPITKEEIYWSNYTAIVEFELEGVPPLAYKAIEGALKNYRIYGNTVGGESVGDLVTSGEHTGEYKVPVTVEGKNLFDENSLISPISDFTWYFDDEHYLLATDTSRDNRGWRYSNSQFRIALSAGTYTLRLSGVGAISRYSEIYVFKSNNDVIYSENITGKTNIVITFTLNTPKTIGIEVKLYEGKYRIMLVEGSTPLPYEPYQTPITTNLYLPEPIKMVGDDAEYVDFVEQKQHRVRKNLLQNTATSQTINGVTFTVNSDGSVTCNGTANNTILYEIHRFPRFSGKCILSGCPINGSKNTCRLQYTNMSNMAYQEYGTGLDIYQFDETQYPISRINIRIENGYTCNNLTFYPMIRKADIEDDTYEPYIENTDLDVTLPALPTLPGTNVLSVGTAVQPSKVYVKYKGERQ